MSTEARVLVAARAVLDDRGLEGFSLREVARRCDLTPMAVYRYYAGRDGLLGAVVQDAFERLLARLQLALSERDAGGRLRQALREYVAFAEDEPESYWLLFSTPLAEAPRARQGRRSATTFRFLVDRLRDARDSGAARDGLCGDGEDALERAAIDLWAQLHGSVALQRCGKLGFSRTEFDAHLRWMIEGVAPS